MNKKLILIPAYQPDLSLVGLVDALHPYADILVVNDGSTGDSAAVFDRIDPARATVIGYAENHGKGYALKYGIRWALERQYTHLVTADADGQHTVEDIAHMLELLDAHQNDLLLGTRDKSQMPLRSRAGNVLTCFFFKVLCNLSITDTQTGLRGICLTPKTGEKLLALSGDRYEYETNMLIEASHIFDNILEVPISTVYEPSNPTSHFRPLQDGWRIYKLLFQKLPWFTLASFASFLLDYGLFNLGCYVLAAPVVAATVAARLCSGAFNFYLNKHFVFKDSGSYYSLGRYAALAVGILAANCVLIWLLTQCLPLPPWFAKVIVELVLYFVSFAIQSHLTRKER